MKENHKLTKTYISETNQNRISKTLSVEDTKEPSSQAEENKEIQDRLVQSQETSAEIYEEPEALSAPLTPLPPTTAAYEAKAVAGFTIGETYGDQGDYVENPKNKNESHTTDNE